MSYHHLTTYERGRIETLHRLGYFNRKIALSLGRHRSCIDRKIKRNTVAMAYQAEIAGQNYSNRRMHSRPKGKWRSGLDSIIEKKLRETWSPEQIASTVTLRKSASKLSTTGSIKASVKTQLKIEVNLLLVH